MNNIPQGYKQTELGIIPEDWVVVSIGDLGRILGGGTPSTTNLRYWDGGIPWFTPSEIGKSKYVTFSCRTISDSGLHASSATLLPEGTILLTTRASIGDSAILLHSASTNQGFQSIVVSSSFSNEFVYYLLKHNVGTMLSLASGSTFLEISKRKLSSINIAVPQSLAEQQAIGKALSDVDALVAALDKKIAKKRLIKQGAMQQLLTGKKRLSGFINKWEQATLGELELSNKIRLYRGKVISNIDIRNNPGSHPIYSSSVINNGLMGRYGKFMFDEKLITWSIDGGGNFFYRNKHKFSVTNVCGYIRVDPSYIDYYFLAMQLQFLHSMKRFDYQLKAHPRIIREAYLVSIPFIGEQQAIAAILSDMDKEIADLEARRDKYELIKSGMMQKLLTGQIRLVKPLASVIPLETPDAKIREIPLQTHVIAGHIVNSLYQSLGWGRTKLQKTLHLVGYHCQLDFGNEYIRNTAGPDDQAMMNHIDGKFKQYRHVKIEEKKEHGKTRYNYIPTAMIDELEQVYETYPKTIRNAVDSLINKVEKMDLARAEIVSTLYAVWNNRIIKGEQISDDLLLEDFYAWSKHKSDFNRDLVLRGLNYMRKEEIIPMGWGKYIDCKTY